MGIDFVGVGGFGNYLPFLRFANSLNIPWIVFSDNDKNGAVKKSVENQFSNSKSKYIENDCLLFLSEGDDFENQLIRDGFNDEIKKAILSLKTYNNEHHEKVKKPKDGEEINLYDDEKLYEVITGDKTQFGPIIADEIINSGKLLPPKIVQLFEKITTLLTNKEAS
jgi:putative ATP-dependent endonuclease of OLD family